MERSLTKEELSSTTDMAAVLQSSESHQGWSGRQRWRLGTWAVGAWLGSESKQERAEMLAVPMEKMRESEMGR